MADYVEIARRRRVRFNSLPSPELGEIPDKPPLPTAPADEAPQEDRPADFLGQFLEWLCVTTPEGRVKVTTLFELYRQWAQSSGAPACSENRFSSRMQARLGVKGGEIDYVL